MNASISNAIDAVGAAPAMTNGIPKTDLREMAGFFVEYEWVAPIKRSAMDN